jgi:4-phospho-D-threonate 3-dehydrogenase / 4-phospho-D-erythronate 3-dehydrogenase
MGDTTRPLLAITMGDPAGIGPEIVLKALAHPAIYQRCRPLVIGDRRILARAADWVGQSRIIFRVVDEPGDGRYNPGMVTVLDLDNVSADSCSPGEVSAAAGRAAVEYVFRACDLAMAGSVDGIVTAPLNKAAMNLAGFAYAGHTELLAERTHTPNVKMLLTGPNLRVIHVSTHVSLREAIERAKQERIRKILALTSEAVCKLKDRARIAVAGLNPHAGENGLFGREEIEEIQPAVEWAKAQGMPIEGPFPPDTLFYLAVRRKQFDAIVCMYHDQGHIPLKLLDFEAGVNVALGLPIIRTSVDHGTAFDIAYKGVASTRSLVSALDFAVRLARGKKG